MADGIDVTPSVAAGKKKVYTDETASGHIQVQKLAVSANGDDTLVPATTDGMAVLPTPLKGAPLSTVVSVGTSAAVLPTQSGRRSVIIQADPANTAYIYIGGSAVTADNAASGGLMLAAGASLPMAATEAVGLYARSTAAGQRVRVLEIA